MNTGRNRNKEDLIIQYSLHIQYSLNTILSLYNIYLTEWVHKYQAPLQYNVNPYSALYNTKKHIYILLTNKRVLQMANLTYIHCQIKEYNTIHRPKASHTKQYTAQYYVPNNGDAGILQGGTGPAGA